MLENYQEGEARAFEDSQGSIANSLERDFVLLGRSTVEHLLGQSNACGTSLLH